MKIPFDIEKAKNGAKVVTRDGRPVEIFKFDFIENGKRRIAYCCTDEDGDNHAYLVNHNGVWMEEKESDQDLFIEVESTYRPYANSEEMDAEIKKHGYIVKNLYGRRLTITGYDDKNVSVGMGSGGKYETLLKSYTWIDGTPCGIMEGGADE